MQELNTLCYEKAREPLLYRRKLQNEAADGFSKTRIRHTE